MPAASIGAGLLAGILFTLSSCVSPLLPLVVEAATSAHCSGPCWLAGGIAASFTAAGLFVATVGLAVGLDGNAFRTASAVLLVGNAVLIPRWKPKRSKLTDTWLIVASAAGRSAETMR